MTDYLKMLNDVIATLVANGVTESVAAAAAEKACEHIYQHYSK